MNTEKNKSEILRKYYFAGVKFGYVLLLLVYIIILGKYSFDRSAGIIITAALCAAAMSIYEVSKHKLLFLIVEAVAVISGICLLSNEFIILLPAVISDVVECFKIPKAFYLSSLVGVIFAENKFVFVLLCILTAIIYYQHYGIIDVYRKSAENYELQELRLKNSIDNSAAKLKSEIEKTNLHYENMILQDKARLSQQLHDKLGHSINGSIYQLEACRAIANTNPEKSEEILGRVIDSLRNGMDEIRCLLRRERPESKAMTVLQLNSLCNDCREKYGIEADLIIEGNSEKVSDSVWKAILNNCCEAVTNSLKYSKCSRIKIEIKILNEVLRCCVSDNGVGCEKIVSGMGIDGMKQRISELGGVINIDGTAGFVINMIIPIG